MSGVSERFAKTFRQICNSFCAATVRFLEMRASAILLLHNHPSGSIFPSKADIDMTYNIRDALKPIEVTLHDHVIVTSSDRVSFRDKGLLLVAQSREPRSAC